MAASPPTPASPRSPLRGVVALPCLAGCSGPQSALDPQGPQAEAIALLWWVMAAGAALILLAVMLLALYAMYRGHGQRLPLRANAFVIGGGVVFPLLVLVALLVFGSVVGGRMVTPTAEPPLRIALTGHQWWWEVRYPDAEPAIVTANELLVPVGRPVELELHSADVVHSVWVPQLAGKVDLIPGKRNFLRFSADHPGRYTGQCAEFCGLQHAHMRLVVVAVRADEFDAMLQQRAQAVDVDDRFVAHGCSDCHSFDHGVADSPGPDLSHYASRVETTPGAGDTAVLARWLTQRHLPDLQARHGRQPPLSADDATALAQRLLARR
jgi:cytochrome c oxidase subunit II